MQFGKTNCVLRFAEGLLTEIDYLDMPAEMIEHAKARFGVGEVQICEFGIGTNVHARVIPTGPIFEKTYGSVHIGCGCNDTFGGKLGGDKHYDCIIQNPTITVDGKLFEFKKY